MWIVVAEGEFARKESELLPMASVMGSLFGRRAEDPQTKKLSSLLFGFHRSQSFDAGKLLIKLERFCQVFVNLFHALPQ